MTMTFVISMQTAKRQKNIREFLVKAKVPPLKRRPKRIINGMKKCNKPCQACPFILEGKEVKCGKLNWKITKPVNCETNSIVYMIQCTKDNCQERYIGETKRSLAARLSEHQGYINALFPSQATGKHFNQPGHGKEHVRITILERVKNNDELYRKEREKFLINKFNTYYRGINRSPE